MMKSVKCMLLLPLLLAIIVSNTAVAQTSSGPQKGALVISGGPDPWKAVTERFVSLAGGPDANFVYIPTGASSLKLPSGFIYDPPNSDIPAANTSEFERELAKLFGVTHISILHTRDRKTADSKSFVEPLRKANGVWLSSGNAGRFAAAYLDTLTQREIEGVLSRGGVIGGNSAGAIIQGSYTVRGRPDKPLLMAKGHERGFALLKNVAINPHLTEQKRDAELVNVLDAHPELLGIGIDEKAALVVTSDRFEVIGEGRVAIYDNRKHGGSWYYWLVPGDSFDLRGRTTVAAAAQKVTTSGVTAMQHCDLIANPSLYDEKEIRLTGVYSVSGTNDSKFFSSSCDSKTLWVEFAPTYESCSDQKAIASLATMRKKSGIRWARPHVTVITADYRAAEVQFLGLFKASNPYSGEVKEIGPPFGNFSTNRSGYDVIFKVSCVERVKPLTKGARY